MDRIRIRGGNRLNGSIGISGAKNAALPLMIVSLLTPGTLTEDTLLDARTNNYLLAIARARSSGGGDRFGLAWIDISTSEFTVLDCATGELAATLARINPNEAIVADVPGALVPAFDEGWFDAGAGVCESLI